MIKIGWLITFGAFFWASQYCWDTRQRARAIVFGIISAIALAVFVLHD